jgi:hypothetical protein
MADDFKPFSLDDFKSVDLDSLILKQPEDYERLARVPVRPKRSGRSTLANGRKRRYRARQRNGTIILSIEASGYELIRTLIEAGFITEAEALDRHKVATATTAVLDRWVRHWQEHGALKNSGTRTPARLPRHGMLWA